MKKITNFFFIIIYFFISLVSFAVLLCLPKNKIHQIYKGLDEKEERKRLELMKPFVKKDDEILDIGAGSGRFAKWVADQLGLKATAVDVCDYSDKSIPFYLYDGKKLPFPDKSFDVVFFAFVLHHTTNQEELIKEASRVARRNVIIFEDTYETFFERFFTAWNDFHTNILQGWIKYWKKFLAGNPSQMPMPYTFRSVTGWTKLFEQLSLKVISTDLRTSGYKPHQKVTFCLEPVSTTV